MDADLIQRLRSREPLAERMRPVSLDEFRGQGHIAGENALVRRSFEEDRVFSMILWGPPGCGKTTLAGLLARVARAHFTHFSAVLSGVKDIRAVIADSEKRRSGSGEKTLLFVDEIHRFNKSQQDAFLPHVESGLITLIGATTENPSFEVIPALMSRCRVAVLKPLEPPDIDAIMENALKDPERGLGAFGVFLEPGARDHLVRLADGDARAALNNLEAAVFFKMSAGGGDGPTPLSRDEVEKALDQKAPLYDKNGEAHYNLISAFHKSLRGSDPDAALYWLKRMLQGGEDPFYIARRMVRFASEDIGNADPDALRIALDAMSAFRFLGSPEGELALSQSAVYLATAPKSNAVYMAEKRAAAAAKKFGSLPVPLHIRNAPTKLMKRLGYGKGYQYDHDRKGAFAPQEHLPDRLAGTVFYRPTERGGEKIVKERLRKWRSLRAAAGKKTP
ncbi:Replication-associated recombination protein A [Candidatus Desulfarcum epimagneticum]|uniref:Replication-associated recombination protein A n=1 Tax=uncultured Desulfobacteraceae bacterium TaxID=218296 RepID=A0A484HJ78_9BACT|nr:Replication-associated recombination protein A [uncultured Desulfobacteraceae bacterium]